jgi:hypothetical protein
MGSNYLKCEPIIFKYSSPSPTVVLGRGENKYQTDLKITT